MTLPRFSGTAGAVHISWLAGALGISLKGIGALLGTGLKDIEGWVWQTELDGSVAAAVTCLPGGARLSRVRSGSIGELTPTAKTDVQHQQNGMPQETQGNSRLMIAKTSQHQHGRRLKDHGQPDTALGKRQWRTLAAFGVLAVEPVLLSPRDGGEVGMEGGGSGLEVEPHHVVVVHGVAGHGAAAT